jgi:hypothetical protein
MERMVHAHALEQRKPPNRSFAMKTNLAKIWLVFLFVLAGGCQSEPLPPVVEVELDRPTQSDVVEFRSLEVVPELKWASANHFGVRVRLPESHKPSVAENVFIIDEMKFLLSGGGAWFRDRFSLKLSVKGHWQTNKDDQGYFVADAFVTYPHGFEFKANDPKARAWLEEQVRELWHEVLGQVRNAR